MNRRDSFKLLLAASGTSILGPLSVVQLAAASSSESPHSTQVEGPRRLAELREGWRFFRSNDLAGAEAVAFDDRAWELVTVPHTWQTFADQTDYSHAWYRKRFTVPANRRGKRIYLRFDGAGIMAEVYLNGAKLGRHVGAYTAFVFDATEHIRFDGDNVLAVRCDSKTDIAGNLSRVTGDDRIYYYFCVATGLHRHVWLITTDACHISPLDYGSSGIYITASNLTDSGVDLSIKTVLRNSEATARGIVLRHNVLDTTGKVAGIIDGRITVAARDSKTQISSGRIGSVAYWSPAKPQLYTVRTEVLVDGVVRDVVLTRTGFRSITMQEGKVAVNGQPTPVLGASLHEISERNFHAIRNDEIRRDMESFREIGFNSAFLGHYPHSQLYYDLADEIGLLVWAEDGFVNGSYEPEISTQIVREMVRQYFNHPSIFCWSAANEPFPENRPATSTLLRVLRAEDHSQRLITFNDEFKYKSFHDPQADFVTTSVFSGWYPNQGDVWKTYWPYVNQQGGGAVISHQSDYRDRYHKVRFGQPPYTGEFEPEGYQLYLGEVFSKRAIENREYALMFWWAMKDFPAENYRGIFNTKGLITFGGYRKDIFYLFQASMRKDINVLHVCGKHWFLRGGEGNCIKVYSNSKQVQLFVNGIDQGSRANGLDYSMDGQPVKDIEFRYTDAAHEYLDYSVDGRSIKHVFYWEHVLVAGRNEIRATDGAHSESCVIYFAPQGKMPEEAGSLVTNLEANNDPVWALNRAPEDEWPVYAQFDGNANNTFDVIPGGLAPSKPNKVTWIVTRRQSYPQFRTDLAFKIAPTVQGKAFVWLLVTRTPAIPAWISQAGFKDTGLQGQWRDDSTYLVDWQLFKKESRAGEQITLQTGNTGTDYLVFVTSNQGQED